MRKFTVAGILVALAVALLAIPASASFDTHFSVNAKQTSINTSRNAFRFKDRLLDPRNRHNKVGRDWGVCKAKPNARRLRCRIRIHLNGKIGGFGDIGVSRNIRPNGHRLNVWGGTHDFNGVAGKMLIHSLNRNVDRYRFALTR